MKVFNFENRFNNVFGSLSSHSGSGGLVALGRMPRLCRAGHERCRRRGACVGGQNSSVHGNDAIRDAIGTNSDFILVVGRCLEFVLLDDAFPGL